MWKIKKHWKSENNIFVEFIDENNIIVNFKYDSIKDEGGFNSNNSFSINDTQEMKHLFVEIFNDEYKQK